MERLEKHIDKKPRKKIPKAVAITVLSVIAVAVIGAVIFFFRPTYISSDKNIPLSIAESYLDKQTTLDDYKITEVATLLNNKEKYVVVSYSVKPKDGKYDEWAVGDGTAGKDGWVDKHSFIAYFNIGNIYFTGINANTGL